MNERGALTLTQSSPAAAQMFASACCCFAVSCNVHGTSQILNLASTHLCSEMASRHRGSKHDARRRAAMLWASMAGRRLS